MPAAPKVFSHCGDIPLPFAAQAQAEAPIWKLTEKSGYFHILNGKSVVHQAFAILFPRAAEFHLLLRHRD